MVELVCATNKAPWKLHEPKTVAWEIGNLLALIGQESLALSLTLPRWCSADAIRYLVAVLANRCCCKSANGIKALAQ